VGYAHLWCLHKNNDLHCLTCMQREVMEGQLAIMLDMCFDTVGLHSFSLHERCYSYYTRIG